MYEALTILSLFAFAYSLVAIRLARGVINGAVVYIAFGVLAGPIGLGWLDLSVGGEGVRTIAELTLALVLFTDASNANLAVLRRELKLPQRLLLVGLPLSIGLGIGAGLLLFPQLGFFEVAILATMLAPTDAALGKSVVTNPVVPAGVREGLNVESGLNDGICVPILFTFLALAVGSEGSGEPISLALRLVAEQLGIGLVVGVALGAAASWALRAAGQRGWMEEPWVGVPVVALALAVFGLAQLAGGSGFIACFSGGLTFGAFTRTHKHAVLQGAEDMGEVMSLVTWVIFGAAIIGQHPGSLLEWPVLLYATLSLTVVRMLPVFLSLTGMSARSDEKLFVGWFGPRGLASVVFAVIVFDAKLPGGDTLVATVVATVVLSILAHGLSANPLARIFGRAHPEAPTSDAP